MTHPSDGSGAGPSHRLVEAAVGVVVALFGLIVVIGSLQVGIGWGAEGPRSGFFPFYVGLAIIVSSGFNLMRLFTADRTQVFAEWHQLRQVLIVVVPTAVYVVAVPWTGIYLASVVLIAGFMMKLGSYRPLTAVGTAMAVMVALYVTFEKWFLVSLPKGPIEDFLQL